VPEVVVTGPSNPGNGCIVNHCYPGGLTPANPIYTPPPATTPIGLPAEDAAAAIAKNMYAIYGKICIEAGESQED
jgi:hypothetical protein